MTPDTAATADTGRAEPQGGPVSLGDAFSEADGLLDAGTPSRAPDDDVTALLDDADRLDPANAAEAGALDADAWISDGHTLLGELRRRGAGEAAEALRTLGPVAANDAALAICNLPDALAAAAEAAGLLRSPEAWRMLAAMGEQARNSLNIRSHAMATPSKSQRLAQGIRAYAAPDDTQPVPASPQDQRQLRAKIVKLRASEAFRFAGHPLHRETTKALETLYRATTGEWDDA